MTSYREQVKEYFRRYFKGAQFNERVSAKGLVAVVTGANSGIGLETVRGLNLAKAKVYMLCRNEERGAEAKIKLAQAATHAIACAGALAIRDGAT
nr:Retinol dehydrogenase 12 [Haemonchus contortus]